MIHRRNPRRNLYLLVGGLAAAGAGYYLLGRDKFDEHKQEVKTSIAGNQNVCESAGYELFKTSWGSCPEKMKQSMLGDYKANPQSFKGIQGVLEEIEQMEYQRFAAAHEKESPPPGLVSPQRLELVDTSLEGSGRFAVLYDRQTNQRYVIREEQFLGESNLALSHSKGIEEKIAETAHTIKRGVIDGYAQARVWVKGNEPRKE